eukprot:574733-Amorphochlora_amoeboformis.AAC.2
MTPGISGRPLAFQALSCYPNPRSRSGFIFKMYGANLSDEDKWYEIGYATLSENRHFTHSFLRNFPAEIKV